MANAGRCFHGVWEVFALKPQRRAYQADQHRDFNQRTDDRGKRLAGIDARYRHRYRNRQFKIRSFHTITMAIQRARPISINPTIYSCWSDKRVRASKNIRIGPGSKRDPEKKAILQSSRSCEYLGGGSVCLLMLKQTKGAYDGSDTGLFFSAAWRLR